jgi:UrcA family protein
MAGAKALALRIRVAAAQVCGGEDPVVRLGDGFYRCQEASIGRAVATLDSPLLADALGRAPQSFARSGR